MYLGASEVLTFVATVPAGGVCGTKPCWKISGTSGFKFKDSEGISEGSAQMSLKAGRHGKAKVTWKGVGVYLNDRPLELPAPPLELPVRAQVHGPNNLCFEANFSSPSTNEAGAFKSKSD